MREQRKVVTVLFCDLVGSTALGESTDPEALRERMRRYFEDLRRILERHGGSVEKFVGDAVMAVFGIPVSHEDDALRAVRAASEMREAIAAHGLEARIGIHTGEVVVGGEGETLVTGDAVNVAARLEQAAGANEVLIGAETRLLVRDAVVAEPLEPLELKGKSQPVDAFRLVEVVSDAAPLARHLETPLVGRERERQRLLRDYEDAVADGTCRLFTLLGPAGIGKSRLVADFLERVRDAADVLRGRCLSYGEGITYWPLVEMLVPIGIAAETVVSSTPEETRVAFRRLLESRAGERPQVVVVDDLQWAEPVFIDLVEHIADVSRGAPIFLLCIARTELLDDRPGWAGGKLNATSLLLEPLDADQCAQLMDRLVPDADLGVELRERIATASAGNPLYVEEMLAMVREQGASEVTVPPTIQVLLQARIDSLDGDVRTIMERGAVEGEIFHRGAVAALVPEGMQVGVDEHLTSLVRKELIRPEDALVPGEDAFRFRHLLIRDAAYAAMPKELRSRLHEGFADWLERTVGEATLERDEIVGYHLEQAIRLRTELGLRDERHELTIRAGGRLLAAGLAARGRADLPAATSLLQRGVDLLPVDDPGRLEALPELAHVLVRSGELVRAEATLRSAIDDAQRLGEPGVEAHARLDLNRLRARVDPTSRLEDELAGALEIASALERAGDLPNLARAYREVGMTRFMLGQAGEGEADLERSAALARQAGHADLEHDALLSRLRPIAWGPTPVEDGIAFCDLLLSGKIANVANKALALHVRALLRAMQGDFDGARNSAADSFALIEEFGLTLSRGIHSMDVGFALALSGDLDESLRVLRRGHELLESVGDSGARCTLDAMLADVLFRTGQADEAAGYAEESRAIAAADDLDAQPRWRAALARIVASRGDHAEAERLAREAVALVEPLDLLPVKADVYAALGEVLAVAGRADGARAAVEQGLAFYELKGNVVSAEHSRAVLAELRATERS
jgi:class 3 adenylate cyclase/tetratricopeptide (TPR) repeat protein